MATAPPDNTPSTAGRPSRLDRAQPNNIVTSTAHATIRIGLTPNDTICTNVIFAPANVIFAPNKATPVRSKVLLQNSMPGRQVVSCDRKWNANLKNSAYNN